MTPGVASAESADIEPNDTIETASGPLREGVTYDGTLQTPQDVDMLRLYVRRAHAQLTLTARNASPAPVGPYGSALWGLDLLDADGGSLGMSASLNAVRDGESGTLSYSFPGAGTYYVSVRVPGGYSPEVPVTYEMNLTANGDIVGYDVLACNAARRAKSSALARVRRERPLLRRAKRLNRGVKTHTRRLATYERRYRAARTTATTACRP